MRAITVRDRDAGVGGLTVTDMPYPRAAENDVIVRVHAAGFTPQRARLAGNVVRSPRPRPDTQHPRARAVRSRGRARVRNHRPHRGPAGVRTDRLDPQRIPGPIHRAGGSQPRPFAADIDHTVAAALPISGLAA